MAKILMVQVQPAPYAGTAYLNGAALSAGHQFVLRLGSDVAGILASISSERPDILGFSCMTGLHTEILAIAREVKKRSSIPIILGGPHPTLFPEVINEPCIDMICRGEGEFALIDLLDAIGNGTPYKDIPNLWVKHEGEVVKNGLRPFVEPLDNVPLIDWSCYKDTVVQKSPPIAFLIRGCPYGCSYCFNESVRGMYKGLGKYVRWFSVERSILEIGQALKIFSPSPVLFTSDTFGIDTVWMDELFRRYTETTDLPFVLLLRPELVKDEVIRIIKKYKCHSVAIGVESGSERVRKEVMNRNYSNRLLLDIAAKLHAAGIRFRTYNMIGLPTETEEELWETIDLNIKMGTDYPRAAIFTPFPGTKMTDIAMEKGYIDPDFSFDDVPATILSHTVLKNVDGDRLKNTLYFFQTAVVFPGLKNTIKKLVYAVKPNIIFKAWFYFMYAYLHRKSEGRNPIQYVQYVMANMRNR